MKKQMEFSKKILFTLGISLAIILIQAFILMFIYGDLEPLREILIGFFALLNIAVGFYYWKAKNENLAKFNKNIIEEENNENQLETETDK